MVLFTRLINMQAWPELRYGIKRSNSALLPLLHSNLAKLPDAGDLRMAAYSPLLRKSDGQIKMRYERPSLSPRHDTKYREQVDRLHQAKMREGFMFVIGDAATNCREAHACVNVSMFAVLRRS